MPKSAAKAMQEITQVLPPGDPKIRVCLRTDVGHEHNMVLAEAAVKALIDPDIPDVFIEVPPPADVPSVKHRFLHTSRIKEVDVFDEFVTPDAPAVPVNRVG